MDERRLPERRPTIVPGIGAEKGVDYLVMEFLEGETLQDRLARGALPLREALELGTQIAEAIDAAHRQGVVHRDLKPGNVMLTRDGARVLDFGLAKGLEISSVDASTQTPTVTQPLTAEGSIIGTLQYMAPEQLEGREADARSDIWGLGVVLYEMATGEAPFEGESQASLIASIMTGRTKPLAELQPVVPARLDWVIGRCLDKDPEWRWQSARDVALELGALGEASEAAAVEAESAVVARASRPVATALVGALALALGVLVGFVLPRPTEDAVDAAGALWTATTLDVPADGGAVLSPDGRTVVFTQTQDGSRSLYRRSLDSLLVQPIPGLDDAGAAGVGQSAFFSPDGSQLALVDAGRSMRSVPIVGGGTTTLAQNVAGAMLWGADGYIYFAPLLPGFGANPEATQAWRIDANGGEAQQMAAGIPTALLPGGQTMLATLRTDREEGFWSDVLAVDVATGEQRVLAAGALGQYLDPGFVVFYRDGALWAVPIDLASGELEAPPRQIESAVARQAGAPVDIGHFSLARSGDLLYKQGAADDLARLVLVSRDGRDIETVAPEKKAFSVPSPSLDGRQISVQVTVGISTEQWTLDLDTGSWSRPSQSGSTSVAQWLPPDGREIVFLTDRDTGNVQVYVQPADRSGPAERLLPSEYEQSWLDISPDGRWFLLFNFDTPGFFAFDRQTGDTRPIVEDGAILAADFHPDGDWIVYSQRVAASVDIWLAPFPGPGEPRQLSFEGGQEPRFSPDGDEIFYRSPTHIQAMPIEKNGTNLVTSRAQPLFEDRFRFAINPGIQNFYPTPDGRFVMVQEAESQEARVILVQNWRAKVLAAFPEHSEQ
jgi:Tol biopolymer transport system component